MQLMFLSVAVLLCCLVHCHGTAQEQDLTTAAQLHTDHGDGVLKAKSAERTHSAKEEESARENFFHFLHHPDRYQETAASRSQDLREKVKQENPFTGTPPSRPAGALERKIPEVSIGNGNLENDDVDSGPVEAVQPLSGDMSSVKTGAPHVSQLSDQQESDHRNMPSLKQAMQLGNTASLEEETALGNMTSVEERTGEGDIMPLEEEIYQRIMMVLKQAIGRRKSTPVEDETNYWNMTSMEQGMDYGSMTSGIQETDPGNMMLAEQGREEVSRWQEAWQQKTLTSHRSPLLQSGQPPASLSGSSNPSVIDNLSISVSGNTSVNVRNDPSVSVSGTPVVSDSYNSFVSDSDDPSGIRRCYHLVFPNSTTRLYYEDIHRILKEVNQVLIDTEFTTDGIERNPIVNDIPYTIDGIARQPVHLGRCRCLRCNKEKELYDRGHFENVAFNKPVLVSDINNQNTEQCNAVDGFDYASRPSCFMSSQYERDPLMQIDLGSVFTIPSLYLFRRDSKEPGHLDQRRMLSIIILVDGRTCMFFNDYGFISSADKYPVELKATCFQPQTGRYVNIRKLNTPYVKEYHFLLLCEVVIWVCKQGTYGSYETGCKPCPADCAYPCDNYYGCSHVKYAVSVKKPADKSHGSLGTAADVNDAIGPRYDGLGCLIMTNTDSSLLWWKVDLIQLFKVYKVYVEPHNEHIMANFSLMVTRTWKTPEHLKSKDLCYFKDGSIRIRTASTFTCTSPMIGRYAVVTRRGPATIAVCSVDVYGHRVYSSPRGFVCNPSDEYRICENGSVCEDGLCKSAGENEEITSSQEDTSHN